MINGITKEEHIAILKECGMCTKKWSLAKVKKYNEYRLQLIKIKQEWYKNNRKRKK